MSGETLAAVLWLTLSAIGVLVSLRAIWRGGRRYRRSDDPVARAVHMAEFSVGLFFFIVFSLAVMTAIISLFILPPAAGASEALNQYSRTRSEILRWFLVGQKALELVIVLIPEILDRHLSRLAEKHDYGRPSEIGRGRDEHTDG